MRARRGKETAPEAATPPDPERSARLPPDTPIYCRVGQSRTVRRREAAAIAVRRPGVGNLRSVATSPLSADPDRPVSFLRLPTGAPSAPPVASQCPVLIGRRNDLLPGYRTESARWSRTYEFPRHRLRTRSLNVPAIRSPYVVSQMTRAADRRWFPLSYQRPWPSRQNISSRCRRKTNFGWIGRRTSASSQCRRNLPCHCRRCRRYRRRRRRRRRSPSGNAGGKISIHVYNMRRNLHDRRIRTEAARYPF
mmetsp:Transcript_27027/g.41739  ORF Transcript_27027/g.41739 Transcript_27027/m.41739 type:complete len:250 (+) Transcript_27027:216-965(+)